MHILEFNQLVSLLSKLEVCLNYALLHFSPTKPVQGSKRSWKTWKLTEFQFPGLASHGI